jgi:hypothetical protein
MCSSITEQRTWPDRNWVDQEKCSPIVEYIRTHNKHPLEWLLRAFYQEPNKRENLKENVIILCAAQFFFSPPTNESPAPLVSTMSNGFFTWNS